MTAVRPIKRQAIPARLPPTEGLYEAVDSFMLRAPLLAVSSYPTANGASAAGQPAIDSRALDDQLRRALAVSSLPLNAALTRTKRTTRDERRLRSALLRYRIRISTRPTPFGLCAGAAMGTWGDHTDVRIADAPVGVHARLDMVGLLHLVTELESRPDVLAKLGVIANPAAFERGGRMSLAGVDAQHGLAGGENVTLRATGAVRLALELAREPLAYERLAGALIENVQGATPDKVAELLRRLWHHGFLLTDLRPPLTAGDPARHVVARLRDIPAAHDVLARLELVLEDIDAWTRLPAAQGAERFATLAAEVRDVTGWDSQTPLQVDMVTPLERCQIARIVADEAVRAAELLMRLTPLTDGMPWITAYRIAFEARFGPDRDIALLEVLDPVLGLGPPPTTAPATGDHAARDQVLLALAANALHDHSLVIDLDEELLGKLAMWSPGPDRVPTSLDLYALVAATSAAAVDAGDFKLVVGPNVGATAAGRNLGRFAHMLAPRSTAALADIARLEALRSPGKVLAELVWVPEKLRSANVVVRPMIREYEVGIASSAHATGARAIRLDELTVRVSGGRFVLVWQRPGDEPCEVVTCAGHMLNHSGAPTICRLLSDISRDRVGQLVGFDWGPARRLPFLPRVQSGRSVLRLAQWRIDAMNAHEVFGDIRSDAHARWRERWQMPRYVRLTGVTEAADHRMLLDLENEDHLRELRREIARLPGRGELVLQESLPCIDDAWVDGPGGRYMIELVVSMVRRASSAARPLAPVTPAVPRLTRLRPPGSDWTSVKLYADAAEDDAFIAGPLAEIVRDTAMHAKRWMFLRYADPDPHLRLRFHGAPDQLVPILCEWATERVSDGLMSRFVLDTYDREVERYGGIGAMAVSEDIFSADSRAVVDLLRLDRSGALPLDRLALAVVSIDDLLAALCLPDSGRLALYELLAGGLHAAGSEYRGRKAELCTLLRGPVAHLRDDLKPVADVLGRRRSTLARCGAALDDLKQHGALTRKLPELCSSYIHLHCNRLLGRDRDSERCVLELLLRTRRSLTAGA
jgi:thiopeptide-type bacteriocin biosynthesis protein